VKLRDHAHIDRRSRFLLRLVVLDLMRSVLDGSVPNGSYLFCCKFAARHLMFEPFGMP